MVRRFPRSERRLRRWGLAVVVIAAIASAMVTVNHESRNGPRTGGTASPTTPSTAAPTPSTAPPNAPPPGTATTPTDQLPSGAFTIVGHDIIDPEGRKYFPIGANVAVNLFDGPYAFNLDGKTASGHVGDAIAWGWNTVRATVICSPPRDGPSRRQTIDRVNDFIDEFTAAHMVVIVTCHDLTGRDVTNLDDNRWAAVHQFWDAILSRNANNPYVWIDYANEPLASSSASAHWLDINEQLIQRVRAKTQNVIVVEPPGSGQDLSRLLASDEARRLIEGNCNVVLSWHNYGAEGDVDSQTRLAQTALREDVPLVIAEFGYDWMGRRSSVQSYALDRRGADFAFDVAPWLGIGSLWWNATGDSNRESIYSLRAGGRGGVFYDYDMALSDGGRRLWALGHGKPDLGPSNASLGKGACPAR